MAAPASSAPVAAVLRGYALSDNETDHAICIIGWTMHGLPRHDKPPVQQ
jgi:hypothetical protein